MDGVSEVAVTQVILDQPEIVAPIRQGKATECRSICGWALKSNLASTPARSTMRAKPAVLKGEPLPAGRIEVPVRRRKRWFRWG